MLRQPAPRRSPAAAVLHARSRIEITAGDVSLQRLQAREGAHLIVRAEKEVDLSDAEFLRSSILAAATATPPLPDREDPGERPPDSTASAEARWKAQKERFDLARRLAEQLGPAEVVSLRRAIVADLVLSGVRLDRCGFAGAHGLDRLRIEATCTFQRAPRWRSRRRVFAEEVALRQTGRRPGGRGWHRLACPGPDSGGASVPTAAEVAGLYRGLRKGLEDAKNEPAAADFYYGEMEMRRRASRGVERGLLTPYWAVSGYGLRAWRAIAALLVLFAVSAALFTQPGFARIPQPSERITRVDPSTGNVDYAPTPTGRRARAGADVGRAVEFTTRESLTITRGTGAPLLETTGRGTAVDLTLRLLAPLLLGLALLAVRGRTKR